jgi:hypothetical protein
LADAADAVARLARRLKEGAAVVEQQEKENRELHAECVTVQRHAMETSTRHARHDCATTARLAAAEEQLADMHACLEDAQRAHRDAAALAAGLKEDLHRTTNERNTLATQLDAATARACEAQARAEASYEERDAARREAHAARTDAVAASARLQQAEELEVGCLS